MSGGFSSEILDKEEFIKRKEFDHHLSLKELNVIKDSFKEYDKNKTNELDINELNEELEKYGIDPKNDESLKNLFEQAKRKGSTSVDFDTFIEDICKNLSNLNTMEELEKIFFLFTENENTDKIEFRHLRKLCPQLSEEEIQEMINKADTDKDGKINYGEFYNIITKRI